MIQCRDDSIPKRMFSATSTPNLVTFNAMIHAMNPSWPLALELFTELGDVAQEVKSTKKRDSKCEHLSEMVSKGNHLQMALIQVSEL